MLAAFFNELISYLKEPSIIIGLVLVMIGLVCVLLSARIVRTVRKVEQVESNDKMLLGIRIIGLLFMIVGLVVNATVVLWG